VTQECAAMKGPGLSCPGQVEYDIAERHDAYMIKCPVCHSWQCWLADQERFVVSQPPAETLDIYGVHGR
jgi:hypothetical protein